MNEIYLDNLKLKTFTEQDVLDYCLLNNLNPLQITELYLNSNQLTDILGIKLFKNLKILNLFNNLINNISAIKDLNKLQTLYLNNNLIQNISDIKYLTNLKFLNINYLKLESDQIQYINSLKNLKNLISINGFENMNILKQLDKDIKIVK